MKRILVPMVYCAIACASSGTPVARFAVRGLDSAGLSGSTRDDRGTIWAVAERRHQLVRFAPAGTPDRTVGIRGVPEDLELESMAWLDHRTLALGTERDQARNADDVLLAQLKPNEAEIVGRWELPWSLWAIVAPPNAGIEGLCNTGEFVVAGGEPVIEDRGARWAPVARMRRAGLQPGVWTPFRLRLTTTKGKLSSLDCWQDDDELELYAIERHYGVGRILYFELPTEGEGSDVAAATVIDVAKLMPNLPNLEGVTRRGRELVILTDHDPDDAVGHTETILLDPFDDDD